MKTKETGSNTTVVLYYNQYDELRVALYDTGTIQDAESIATARGVKPVGIIRASRVISEYQKQKNARKDTQNEKNED